VFGGLEQGRGLVRDRALSPIAQACPHLPALADAPEQATLFDPGRGKLIGLRLIIRLEDDRTVDIGALPCTFQYLGYWW